MGLSDDTHTSGTLFVTAQEWVMNRRYIKAISTTILVASISSYLKAFMNAAISMNIRPFYNAKDFIGVPAMYDHEPALY
ncbi:hypothetical protein BBBOND_0209920 [Babesia bigemina]|uniref:Uncharacterized protein n=1 Tax=Babesia bigemina TaxID=5866 RepID=A0A061DAD3_BABBI|nr:hypothetical protein BBBOND_0209920 [Babesia bigemina]CDR95839.1 hypothetical protein BBBOND_0209920 [Babesia bigemina]|eukprot:XP_012768025.1 hypothetical protein BBBOND_0209920 [Babesia bigemina]